MKSNEEEPLYKCCANPIDDCKCVCPYCGETVACDCCIGPDAATGGG